MDPKDLIARGRTAEVFAWQPGQVLKLYYEWVPQNWVDHEVIIGQQMAGLDIPAPRLLETLSVDNRRGVVYERVEGQSLLAQLHKSPWNVAGLSCLMAQVQSRIHQSNTHDFNSIKKSLESQIERVDLLNRAQKERIQNYLKQLPEGNSLLHYDMHFDQVLLSSQGPVVIDWVNVAQGHPMADVARSTVMFRMGNAPGVNLLEGFAINLIRKAAERAYLKEYFRLNPQFTVADLVTWFLPVAAARLIENIQEEQPATLAWVERMLMNIKEA